MNLSRGRSATDIEYPMVIPLTTLALVDDIVRVYINRAITITKIIGSLRVLVSGTHTIALKNDAGSTLGTITFNAAGVVTANPSITSVVAGDTIHVNLTSLGTGAVDTTITVWYR